MELKTAAQEAIALDNKLAALDAERAILFAEIRKQIERATYPGNRHERRKTMAKDRRK